MSNTVGTHICAQCGADLYWTGSNWLCGTCNSRRLVAANTAPTGVPQLSCETMDQIARSHGCTMNLVNKSRRGQVWVYLRHEGLQFYLGDLAKLSQMSEADFGRKVAKKLEEQYV